MDLLCIKDEREVDALLGVIDFRSSKYTCLPLMPKAALALLDLGVEEVKLAIEFLERTEREAILQQAIDLSKSWYAPLKDQVMYRGVDLLECCRLQMIGFFQDILVAETVSHRIIETYKPEKALFFNRSQIPSAGDTMHNGSSDILSTVLQWHLGKEKIRIDLLSENGWGKRCRRKMPSLISSRVRGVLHGTRQLLFPAQWWTPISDSADPKRISLSELPHDAPLCIGYGSGYDLLVIWPYLKALAKESKGIPVLINSAFTFNASTVRSGLVQSDDMRFVYVGDIPRTAAKKEDVKIKDLCNTLRDGKKRNTLLPSLLRNPLLDFQFKHLCSSLLPQALKAVQQASSFFQRYRVALYLDDYCAGVENRAWTFAGNRAGITTVTVSHGGVNLVEFFDFISSWSLTRGELDRKSLTLAFPEKREHLITAGDPVMENLRAGFSHDPETARKSVLLVTGGFLHQAWTDIDLQGFVNTWREVERTARERPSIAFIIKPHPSVRDLGYWYKDFVQKKSLPNVKVVDHQRLEDLLPEAFLVVLCGKPGTAGLVAALAGIPFVYWDTMLCRDVIGYRIWCEENGVPRVTHPVQLAEIIDQLYMNSVKQKTLLEQNKRFLSLYLHPFHPSEVCRQIGLIH